MRESERKREVSYFFRGPTDSAARQAASSCNILMGDAAAALLARTIFVLTQLLGEFRSVEQLKLVLINSIFAGSSKE